MRSYVMIRALCAATAITTLVTVVGAGRKFGC
jgi:hypothetical protein